MKTLGSTGLTVSSVCAGGSGLGSMPDVFGYDVSADQAVEVVLRVFDSPLTWIDTSNGYSAGESERRIGRAIREYGGLPAGFLVATKVDALGNDYSAQRVRDSVAESKERLELDDLPLVYLHDPEFNVFEEMRPAVDALQQLRADGVIGHVGLAGGNPAELGRYLDLGGFEVLLVHNRWTLVDHSAEALIERAVSDGLGVVNAAVYGGGILANPAGATKYGYLDAPDAVLRAVADMDAACRAHGVDLATAALRHSVDNPNITATVVGITKPSRVDALEKALAADLPAELLTQLAALLPDRQYWLEG
ncbi:aldo/keto reductase [Kribbella sandramycini]|uniref:Aldo/keto reductase n=1 Tax=Kribbella sandramycini TaxID=60450 RepID=A0A7Y4KYK7_9ACTN|nr:aldo/keto reductase [Kribbella sandramycini]MBB6569108.1 D-threo-aldose 1-dehydrogenase [Kribbella sandramycini]NOL41049.1 aldo/keto reductase [Kribbella sandramycini]